MYEFRYAKEHAITRTFHKAFQLVERCVLLLGLMVAVSLEAQQSSPVCAQRGPVSCARPVNLFAGREG